MSNNYKSIQGNLGLSKAIDFFVSNEDTVSIPLKDTQSYDLVADIKGKLYRVQVKTCTYINGGGYLVGLKSAGGNSYYSNKGSNYRIKNFDNSRSDLLFIYTGDNRMYLIPTNEIESKSSITVGNEKTEKYEVYCKKLSDYT